jgi:hypothetical protein
MNASKSLKSIEIRSCLYDEYDGIDTFQTMPFEDRVNSFDFKKLFKSVTIKKQNLIFQFTSNIKEHYTFHKVLPVYLRNSEKEHTEMCT